MSSELQAVQNRLYDLIRDDTPVRDDDPDYIKQVAGTPNIAMLREVSNWWIGYNLETGCPYTHKLMRRLDLWYSTLEAEMYTGVNEAHIPTLADRFLGLMSDHKHPMVAALAKFERALKRIKRGDKQTYVTEWQHNPYELLAAVIDKTPLEDVSEGNFQTELSLEIEGLFTAYALEPKD
ncbi:MAG: hypothetical protein QNK37_10885 [Acidobacteriota bacterium]|nr:hypothetical protein [Acidobacteriota bacterium]